MGGVALAILGSPVNEIARGRVGQQHADFLEGLADGADPEAESLARPDAASQSPGGLRGREPRAEGLGVIRHVVGLDLASGEDVVAPRELALRVALDEERLDAPRRPIAQEHEGRCGKGNGRLGHGRGSDFTAGILSQITPSCPSRVPQFLTSPQLLDTLLGNRVPGALSEGQGRGLP